MPPIPARLGNNRSKSGLVCLANCFNRVGERPFSSDCQVCLRSIYLPLVYDTTTQVDLSTMLDMAGRRHLRMLIASRQSPFNSLDFAQFVSLLVFLKI